MATEIKWADGQAITADSTIRWADGQPFVYYAVATIIETQGSLDDFWVDITDAAIFLTDQNGDIMYTQDGNPIMASGSTSVEWTDIS
jgi:hypothetical protein